MVILFSERWLVSVYIYFVEDRSITNKVRNRARPTITWLAGADCVPIACRSSDNTMMMRVKLVIINNAPARKTGQLAAAASAD